MSTLIKQILTEWKSNMWLAVELLIVSVVLWFIIALLLGLYRTYTHERGFDIEHCYMLTFDYVSEKSPDFIARENTDEGLIEDNLEILNRMQHHPIVEAASLSQAWYPYNYANSGTSFWTDGYEANRRYSVRRMVSPDFVKVFRYRGTRGETPEQLAEMLRRGDFLVSDGYFVDKDGNPRDMTPLIGKGLYNDMYDTTVTHNLGAVLVPPRYNDFSMYGLTGLMSPIENQSYGWYGWMKDYCIRVRPEADKDVHDLLMDQAESLFHVGNKVLVDVTSFDDVRESFNRDTMQTVRNMVVIAVFLLVNIFLGLLGTFWFRTSQRVGEMAIRLSFGATPGSVFRRLLSEGLIILLAVTPVAFGLDCLITHNGLNGGVRYDDFALTAYTAALTFGLIALMIVAGIWFPASRAAKIDPAIALKDE